MEATPVFSAALARAIDENMPHIKTRLLLAYQHMKASGALDDGASCCFYIRHIDQTCKGAFRAGCMIEPEPIPYQHYVFIHYEWKQQPDVADGNFTKWIGVTEFEMQSSKAVHNAIGAVDVAQVVLELADIIMPYLLKQ